MLTWLGPSDTIWQYVKHSNQADIVPSSFVTMCWGLGECDTSRQVTVVETTVSLCIIVYHVNFIGTNKHRR